MAKFRDDVRNHVVTWAEVHRDTKTLARRLVGQGPWKGIVALTRGGLVPAAILARELDLRIVDTLCISSYDEQVQGSIRVLKTPADAGDGEGWLLVDDLVDTGTTAREARRILPKAHFATIYAKPAGADVVDTAVSEVEQDVWLFFPWDTEPRYVKPLADTQDRPLVDSQDHK
jgi:xanthine phosphoribosyltransferase